MRNTLFLYLNDNIAKSFEEEKSRNKWEPRFSDLFLERAKKNKKSCSIAKNVVIMTKKTKPRREKTAHFPKKRGLPFFSTCHPRKKLVISILLFKFSLWVFFLKKCRPRPDSAQGAQGARRLPKQTTWRNTNRKASFFVCSSYSNEDFFRV